MLLSVDIRQLEKVQKFVQLYVREKPIMCTLCYYYSSITNHCEIFARRPDVSTCMLLLYAQARGSSLKLNALRTFCKVDPLPIEPNGPTGPCPAP